MGNWKIGEKAKMQAMAAHRPVLRQQVFENHMLTEGLREAAEQGEVQATTHVELIVNLQLTIGGLARVKGLSAEQRSAAALFREVYEGSMIGGARAIDYSLARVDVSSMATNPADGGIDARRRYRAAVQHLGLTQSSLIENVVCHDMSVRELARRMGVGEGDQARQRTKRAVLDAVDRLVDHFGLVPQPGRPRLRATTERPTDWSWPPVDDSGQ